MEGEDDEAAPLSNKTAMALMLLKEGRRQVIKVDRRAMLSTVLSAAYSAAELQFTETECGQMGVKYSVNVEFIDAEHKGSFRVKGGTFASKSDAEEDAVLHAFRHLDEKCGVKVIDYSTRVSYILGAYKTYACVVAGMNSLGDVLGNFEAVLGDCRDLQVYLEEEGIKQQLILENCTPGNCVVYGEVSKFLGALVTKFSKQASRLKDKLAALGAEKLNHDSARAQKSWAINNKCYKKTIHLPAKKLLDYVLSYFGFETAKYTNGPAGDGVVESIVHFTIPYIDKLKLCGNLTIKGKGDRSMTSEEDAAFQALMMFENNCNVKIIGINHSDRVEAEEVQIMLATMVDNVLAVGEELKQMWLQVLSNVQEYREHFTDEIDSLLNGSKTRDQAPAYEICNNELSNFEQDSAKLGYCHCSDMFDRMEKIASLLSGAKLKLGMI